MGRNRLCLDPTVSGDCSTLGELQPLFCDDGGEKDGDVERESDASTLAASISVSYLPERTSRKLLGDVPESLELASSASLSLDFDRLLQKRKNTN